MAAPTSNVLTPCGGPFAGEGRRVYDCPLDGPLAVREYDMNCSFCKRREASARMECSQCWQKYFACSVCAMDWKGKLTHCGRSLGTTGYLGGSKEVRPLDELMREACERTSKFSAKMSLGHLEVLIGEPSTIIATGTTSNLKEVLHTFALSRTVESIQQSTVAQYIDFLVENSLYSGSCGATSEWLDSVTQRSGRSEAMVNSNANALLDRLADIHAPAWYCRVTREPHSFLIECLGGTARIYQSYFSKYGLAHCLKEIRAFPIQELLTLLRQTLLETAGDPRELTRMKRLLYLCDVQWRDPVVKYSLNLNPLESGGVARNVHARLAESRDNWQPLLSQKLASVLPQEAQVDDVIGSLGPVQSPQTLTCKWGELDGWMQIEEERVSVAHAGQFQVGEVLKSWYPDGAEYRVTGVKETEYTLRRV